MSRIDVLDPRFDHEPRYWAALRQRAGLRADWAWDVLAVQAWCARVPQLITVLHGQREPRGVVAAAWVGTRTRRHRFVDSRLGGRWGGLDIRAPGNSTEPGWWFADAGTDGGCRELRDEYLPAMRRHQGCGLRGALLRQVPSSGVPVLDGRMRLIRQTEKVARLHTGRFADRAEWMSSLDSKRRSNLTKIARAIGDDTTVEVDIVAGADVDAVSMSELLRHNERKHHDVPIVPLPQFICYLDRLLRQPDTLVLRYRERDSGRLLAVGTILDDPLWPILRSWAALPVDSGGRPDLYFHAYTELVTWCISAGKRGVLLGKKMAKLKVSLGAETVPQYAAAVPLC